MSASNFDYALDFKNTVLYRVGRVEQGIFLVEPYESEILPYRRFRIEEIARESAEKVYGKRNGQRRRAIPRWWRLDHLT